MRGNARPPEVVAKNKRNFAFLLEFAGPLLIVVLIAVLMNDYFAGIISKTNTDIPSVFVPNHCFMSDSLRQGTIPAWNPTLMGGTPFAGDPQSGWMYLPAMLFGVLLPCGNAVSFLLVFHLWLAGIGVYAFLRSEGCSREAATGAGIVLALSAAGSNLVNSLPFGGALGWPAVLLACASQFFSARDWAGRLLWLVPTALAWGQLAAIHLSQGLVLGTGALLAFGVLRMVQAIRAGDLPPLKALGLVALLIGALGAVNLAYLLPRLSYLPHSTFSVGFRRLAEIATGFRDSTPSYGIGKYLLPTFPLRLGLSPGGYLGATALMLTFAGLLSRRRRALSLTFLIYGVLFLLASSEWVIKGLKPILLQLPGGEFATHNPGRLSYALPFALAILAGLGIDAWSEQASVRTRAMMVAPGIVIFGILPVIFGATDERMRLLWLGAAVGAVLLIVVVRWPRLAFVLPLLLAVELSANVIEGRSFEGVYQTGMEVKREWWPLEPVSRASRDLVDFEQGGAIARRVTSEDRGRIVTLIPGPTRFRPAISGAEEAQGYNPTQLLRYWTFIRYVYRQPLIYSHSTLSYAPEPVQDLLGVGWLVKGGDDPVTGLLPPVAREGPIFLFPFENPTPRASLVSDVEIVDDEMASLRAVAAAGFDSERTVVVESGTLDLNETPSDPQPAGEASYQAIGSQDVRIEVQAARPAVLVVRNTFDRNWTATLDGEPVEVAPVDYFLQGIPVPAGDHVVELAYRDPSIGWGLWGSALAIGALLGAALVVSRSARRQDR